MTTATTRGFNSGRFVKSRTANALGTKQHPLIAPSTPDPYTPPK
jgi:hypothetical protein